MNKTFLNFLRVFFSLFSFYLYFFVLERSFNFFLYSNLPHFFIIATLILMSILTTVILIIMNVAFWMSYKQDEVDNDAN